MSYIIGCVVTILELVHMDRQDVRWLRNLIMLLLVNNTQELPGFFVMKEGVQIACSALCFHYLQLVKKNKRLESRVIVVRLALVTAWKNSVLGVFLSLNLYVYCILKFQMTFLLFV